MWFHHHHHRQAVPPQSEPYELTKCQFKNILIKEKKSSNSKYKDPNNMNSCFFKVSNSPYYTSQTYLSKDFQIKEFKATDGSTYIRLSPILVECLQLVRDKVGTGVGIKWNGGYRTINSNKGYHWKSTHLSGVAADAKKPNSIDILSFAKIIICECKPLFESKGYKIGLGLANTYIHIDFRKEQKHWIEYKSKVMKSKDEWGQFIQQTATKC